MKYNCSDPSSGYGIAVIAVASTYHFGDHFRFPCNKTPRAQLLNHLIVQSTDGTRLLKSKVPSKDVICSSNMCRVPKDKQLLKDCNDENCRFRLLVSPWGHLDAMYSHDDYKDKDYSFYTNIRSSKKWILELIRKLPPIKDLLIPGANIRAGAVLR